MKAIGKYVRALTGCEAVALLALALSRWFIRNAGQIVGAFARSENDAPAYAARVLEQLRRAEIASPWLLVVLFGALGLWRSGARRARRRAGYILCGAALFALLVVLAVLMSEVNSIRVAELLRSLLPMLRELT